MASTSLADRLAAWAVSLGFNYVIARWAFHLPYAAAIAFFTAGYDSELYFQSRALGVRK